jgi:hypothetical protein
MHRIGKNYGSSKEAHQQWKWLRKKKKKINDETQIITIFNLI